MRVPVDSRLIRSGDLLEGVVAAAALVLMVLMDVAWWLAIPLAVVTYIGVGLVRSRGIGGDEADADLEPQKPAVEAPHDLPRPFPGEWTLDPVVAERFGLTRTERKVLLLVAQRRRDREIAESLCISHRTVMNHVSRILGKLGLESRDDVFPFAEKHGLLVPALPPNGSE